ncbi:hypothetical protein [Endozoicomonas atrinae]|uniref:hypothetical protein n=1 Tax=Endozoicomonas atrinae TaxID=1333660 RepID=UPI003B009887
MAYLRYQSQTFRNASDRVRRLFFASNTRNDHNSVYIVAGHKGHHEALKKSGSSCEKKKA